MQSRHRGMNGMPLHAEQPASLIKSPTLGARASRSRGGRTQHEAQNSLPATQRERAAGRAPSERRAVRHELQAKRRTLETLIEAYLDDHRGGNHSDKTIEWHRISLGFLRAFFEEELAISQIDDVEAEDISAWFSHMRTSPGPLGKLRSERTIQTYARSARAFFHWLVHRGILQCNPFDRVSFPKVGRPLIQTLSYEEFEQLLYACAPPNETGFVAQRATARNRAILWLLYDTGIRVSELCGLRTSDLDRKRATITVLGKGSKQRRLALGQNCLRNLLYYLDKFRPDEEELADWGSAGEDHLFLSETRRPLTKNGVELLFKRLKQRSGIVGKRVSPHILRHTFSMNYLLKSRDPFSLQELLGHEDLSTSLHYLHMNDDIVQEQKRKYSPGDHIPVRMPGPRETRRRGFQPKPQRRDK